MLEFHGHIKIVALNVVHIEQDPNSEMLCTTALGIDTQNLTITGNVQAVDTC